MDFCLGFIYLKQIQNRILQYLNRSDACKPEQLSQQHTCILIVRSKDGSLLSALKKISFCATISAQYHYLLNAMSKQRGNEATDYYRTHYNLNTSLLSVPDEFSYDPVTKTYGEPQRRPEIKSSTIEFIAPSDYMVTIPNIHQHVLLL